MQPTQMTGCRTLNSLNSSVSCRTRDARYPPVCSSLSTEFTSRLHVLLTGRIAGALPPQAVTCARRDMAVRSLSWRCRDFRISRRCSWTDAVSLGEYFLALRRSVVASSLRTGGARRFLKTPRTLETLGIARSATASLESSELGVFDISVVMWTLLVSFCNVTENKLRRVSRGQSCS
jgi:hypothetical protein